MVKNAAIIAIVQLVGCAMLVALVPVEQSGPTISFVDYVHSRLANQQTFHVFLVSNALDSAIRIHTKSQIAIFVKTELFRAKHWPGTRNEGQSMQRTELGTDLSVLLISRCFCCLSLSSVLDSSSFVSSSNLTSRFLHSCLSKAGCFFKQSTSLWKKLDARPQRVQAVVEAVQLQNYGRNVLVDVDQRAEHVGYLVGYVPHVQRQVFVQRGDFHAADVGKLLGQVVKAYSERVARYVVRVAHQLPVVGVLFDAENLHLVDQHRSVRIRCAQQRDQLGQKNALQLKPTVSVGVLGQKDDVADALRGLGYDQLVGVNQPIGVDLVGEKISHLQLVQHLVRAQPLRLLEA
ncbi:hypothetical protein BpHYR1_021709 [Brachionus plicatilis]|uniref:Secreted protein n=1 Tax=Brachionus plicatilis TaxID=10195 RepID=A0A3M7T5Z7_BRAPC|nr:hypothetical protein BpHYR1_021709 [Brachionus plicatilis]